MPFDPFGKLAEAQMWRERQDLREEQSQVQNALARARTDLAKQKMQQLQQEQRFQAIKNQVNTLGPVAKYVLDNPGSYQQVNQQIRSLFPETANVPDGTFEEDRPYLEAMSTLYDRLNKSDYTYKTTEGGEIVGLPKQGGNVLRTGVMAKREKPFDIGETREVKRGRDIITQEYTPEGWEQIATAPRSTKKEKPFDIGETREIKKGDRIITQEYTSEGWKQIADAPRSVAEPGGGITRKDLLSDIASINNKIASLQARQNIVSEAMQEEIDTAISGLSRAKNAYLQVLQGDATMEDFPSLLAGESPQRKEAEPEITQILKDENMPAGKKYKDEETGKIYYWDGTTATVVNE